MIEVNESNVSEEIKSEKTHILEFLYKQAWEQFLSFSIDRYNRSIENLKIYVWISLLMIGFTFLVFKNNNLQKILDLVFSNEYYLLLFVLSIIFCYINKLNFEKIILPIANYVIISKNKYKFLADDKKIFLKIKNYKSISDLNKDFIHLFSKNKSYPFYKILFDIIYIGLILFFLRDCTIIITFILLLFLVSTVYFEILLLYRAINSMSGKDLDDPVDNFADIIKEFKNSKSDFNEEKFQSKLDELIIRINIALQDEKKKFDRKEKALSDLNNKTKVCTILLLITFVIFQIFLWKVK